MSSNITCTRSSVPSGEWDALSAEDSLCSVRDAITDAFIPTELLSMKRLMPSNTVACDSLAHGSAALRNALVFALDARPNKLKTPPKITARKSKHGYSITVAILLFKWLA